MRIITQAGAAKELLMNRLQCMRDVNAALASQLDALETSYATCESEVKWQDEDNVAWQDDALVEW